MNTSCKISTTCLRKQVACEAGTMSFYTALNAGQRSGLCSIYLPSTCNPDRPHHFKFKANTEVRSQTKCPPIQPWPFDSLGVLASIFTRQNNNVFDTIAPTDWITYTGVPPTILPRLSTMSSTRVRRDGQAARDGATS